MGQEAEVDVVLEVTQRLQRRERVEQRKTIRGIMDEIPHLRATEEEEVAGPSSGGSPLLDQVVPTGFFQSRRNTRDLWRRR